MHHPPEAQLTGEALLPRIKKKQREHSVRMQVITLNDRFKFNCLWDMCTIRVCGLARMQLF